MYWKFNFNLICSKIRQIIDTKHLIKLITLAIPILSLLTAHRCTYHLPDSVQCPGLGKAHNGVHLMLWKKHCELSHRSLQSPITSFYTMQGSVNSAATDTAVLRARITFLLRKEEENLTENKPTCLPAGPQMSEWLGTTELTFWVAANSTLSNRNAEPVWHCKSDHVQ